jgi:hypothetical protein
MIDCKLLLYTSTHSLLQLNVVLNGTICRKWATIMHEKGHTIYGMAGMYGTVYSLTSVPEGKHEGVDIAHELQRTESVHINTKKRGCHEGSRVFQIKKCLEEYIEDEMQCQLPWNDGHKITYPRCIETEQYKIYLQLLKEENSHLEFTPSA